MKASIQTILKASQEMLDLIQKETLSPAEADRVTEATLKNFREHVNPGFLDYRKSVSTDYTAVEWRDSGTTLTDVKGKEYIDCLGGFGIYNHGHRHPVIVQTVLNQLKKQALHSQELLDPLRGMLAHLLCLITPDPLQYAFFTNSGTEATEGAMKLARLHTGKKGFIAAVKGFHGKSMGALSATAKGEFRSPFLPLVPGFHHLPFGDHKAVEATLKGCSASGDEIAAVILEPIQGEGGINIPPDDYLPAVRELCTRYGTLLIFDEVQTGMGRTGKIFAMEHWNVVPDILCLGKAFGGGVMPAGAFLASKEVWEKMTPNPFLHTSTFGGNPLACAAAIAAIHLLLAERLHEKAATSGKYFLSKLQELAGQHREICLEARGRGLMLGIEFISDEVGFAFSKGCFDRGVLVAGTLINAKTVRVEPPLEIPVEQIDRAITVMREVLETLKAGKPTPSGRSR